MSRGPYDPQQEQANMLKEVADELEELNSHFLAYLKIMALNLLTPCGPGSDDQAQKGREAAALELLQHVKKARERNG